MEQQQKMYSMKCPKHGTKLRSNNKISIVFPYTNEKKKVIKANVESIIYFCDKCDEFYISNKKVNNNTKVFIKDIYGGLYITNTHMKQNVVTKYSNSYEYKDLNLIKQEIRNLLGLKSITYGYDKKVCDYDGVNLIRENDISIRIKNIQKKSRKSNAVTQCYSCPKCKRFYFVKNIITPLKYHLKSMDDIISICKLSLEGKIIEEIKFSEYSRLINEESKKIIIELLDNNTEFKTGDYNIRNKIPNKCDDGAKLQKLSKLISYKLKDKNYCIKGAYCPKCHRLYISGVDIKNAIIGTEKNIILKQYSEVKVFGFDSLTNKIIDLKPDKLYRKAVSYNESFKDKNFTRNVIIRSVLEQKDYTKLNDILSKYGYSISSLGYSLECEFLNNDLISFFQIKNIDNIFYNTEDFEKSIIDYIDRYSVKKSIAERSIINDTEADYFDLKFVYSEENSNLSFTIVMSVLIDDIINDISEKIILESITKSYIEFNYGNKEYFNYLLDKNYRLFSSMVKILENKIIFMIDKIKNEKMCFSRDIFLNQVLKSNRCTIQNNSNKKK